MDGLSDTGLALTRLKAWVCFIDDVKTAFATDNFTVAVAVFQGFQRRTDYHDLDLLVWALCAHEPIMSSE